MILKERKDAVRPRFAGGGFAAVVASLTFGDLFSLPLRRERQGGEGGVQKKGPRSHF